jgi:hypothetical protein
MSNRQQRRALARQAAKAARTQSAPYPLNLPFAFALPTTPTAPLSHRVLALCSSISHEEPLFLPFKAADPRYLSGNCHLNVAHMVRQHGGTVQCGWMIWSSPMLVDAEFHAVWKSPTGKFCDVTPRVDGEEMVLFLPDHSRRLSTIDDGRAILGWANRTDSAAMPFALGGLPAPGERASIVWNERVVNSARGLGMGDTLQEIIAVTLNESCFSAAS